MYRTVSPARRPQSPHHAARRIATLLAGITLLAACDLGSPTELEEEAPNSTINPLFGAPGCDGNQAGAAFSSSSSYRILHTLGNAQADARFWGEVSLQREFWGSGVPSAVFIINEGGARYANAWAFPSGWIGFGYYFYHQHVAEHGLLAIDGTLAHEWGHRAQQTFGWGYAKPTSELEADAFSGYYMGLSKGHAWSQIQGYYNHFYSIGDNPFNHTVSHGSPRQRLAAVYLGVNTAIYAMQRRERYSYAQLHEYFVQVIHQQILPNRSISPPDQPLLSLEGSQSSERNLRLQLRDIVDGRSLGQEVTYPQLTREELRRLWPGDGPASERN